MLEKIENVIHPVLEMRFVKDRPALVGYMTETADSFLATAAWVLSQEGIGFELADAQAGYVWFKLRQRVPLLVVRALDGNEVALATLLIIRRDLDPSIDVPWRQLGAVTQEDLNEGTVWGDGSFRNQERLIRLHTDMETWVFLSWTDEVVALRRAAGGVG